MSYIFLEAPKHKIEKAFTPVQTSKRNRNVDGIVELLTNNRKKVISEVTIDSDFSDMEEFVEKLKTSTNPKKIYNKRQRFVYGSQAEKFIDECNKIKAPNPFDQHKHNAEFPKKHNKTNVSFIAKVIRKNTIIDCQTNLGESFSFAIASVLDSVVSMIKPALCTELQFTTTK